MFREGNRIWTCATKVWNTPFVLLYTDDNGENWNEVAVDSFGSKRDIGSTLVQPKAMFIKGDNFWFATAPMGFNMPPSVWHSADHGKTFVYDSAGLASGYIESATGGFAYTFDGSLWVVPDHWNIFRKKIDNGIQTLHPVTTAPTLVLPFPDWTVPTPSPKLVWSAVPNAVSYHVQVSTDVNFSTMLTDQTGVTDTTYQLSTLTVGATYYWRISATGDDQKDGPWSSVQHFVIGAQESVASADALHISIAPNPATDRVLITGEALQSIAITDVLGKEVTRIGGIAGDSYVLPLAGFAPGIYMVHVTARDRAHAIARVVIR